MLRHPAFSVTVILTLALGIGANCAIFAVLNAVLIRKLPYPEPDRIVHVWEANRSRGIDRDLVSAADYLDWKRQNLPFSQMAAWNFQFFNLSGRDEAERVQGLRVSDGYFEILGVKAVLGRTILQEDNQPGRDRVVVLSDGLWRRRFASDPNIVGQAITFEGEPHTVIGVLPRDFRMFRVLNRELDVWVPYPLEGSRSGRDMHVLFVYARLANGVPLAQAEAAMAAAAARLAQQYPETNSGWTARVVPIPQQWSEGVRPIMMLLQAAAALVLLIGCANIANLLLARGAARRQEIAIRFAIGAGRRRILRQLLTEALLLSTFGGIAGVVLANALIGILNRMPYSAVNRLERFEADVPVLAFSAALSIAAGLLAGFAPAWQTSTLDLRPRPSRLRQAIVTAEVAVATVLLIASGVVIGGALRLESMPRGVDLRNVLTMQLWLPRARYANGEQIGRFYRQIMERAQRLPGVLSTAAINFPPLSQLSSSVGVEVSGELHKPGEEPQALYWIVTPGYWPTMGIPLLQGRAFDEHDDDETHGVVVVSRSFAHRFWPGQNAVGKVVRPLFPAANYYWIPQSANRPLTVMGVSGDVRLDGLPQSVLPQMYLPYRQNPSSFMHLLAKTHGDPLQFAASVKREIEGIDKDEPVFDVKTMEDVFADSFTRPGMIRSVLSSFAIAALLLAGLGVYGVLVYFVSQRRPEIGLRMALGAQREQVMRFVVWQGIGPVLIGIMMGVAGGLATIRLLASILSGIESADVVAFFTAPMLLAGIALMATWLAARRATRIDPMAALRHD